MLGETVNQIVLNCIKMILLKNLLLIGSLKTDRLQSQIKNILLLITIKTK